MDGYMDGWIYGWIGSLPENLVCIYKKLPLTYSVPKEILDFGYHPAPEKFCTL